VLIPRGDPEPLDRIRSMSLAPGLLHLPNELVAITLEFATDFVTEDDRPNNGTILLNVIHINSRTRKLAFSLPRIWRSMATRLIRWHTVSQLCKQPTYIAPIWRFREASTLLEMCTKHSRNTLDRIEFISRVPPCAREAKRLLEIIGRSSPSLQSLELPEASGNGSFNVIDCGCLSCQERFGSPIIGGESMTLKAVLKLIAKPLPVLKTLSLSFICLGGPEDGEHLQEWLSSTSGTFPQPETLSLSIQSVSDVPPALITVLETMMAKTTNLMLCVTGDLPRLSGDDTLLGRLTVMSAATLRHLHIQVPETRLRGAHFFGTTFPQLEDCIIEAPYASSPSGRFDPQIKRSFMPKLLKLDVPAVLLDTIDAPNLEDLTVRIPHRKSPVEIICDNLMRWSSLRSLRLDGPAMGEWQHHAARGGVSFQQYDPWSARMAQEIDKVLKGLLQATAGGIGLLCSVKTIILTYQQDAAGVYDEVQGDWETFKEVCPPAKRYVDGDFCIINQWPAGTIPSVEELRRIRRGAVLANKQNRHACSEVNQKREADEMHRSETKRSKSIDSAVELWKEGEALASDSFM
jgi:hypothetical protein